MGASVHAMEENARRNKHFSDYLDYEFQNIDAEINVEVHEIDEDYLSEELLSESDLSDNDRSHITTKDAPLTIKVAPLIFKKDDMCKEYKFKLGMNLHLFKKRSHIGTLCIEW